MTNNTLHAVPSLDLTQYAGRWYEIASYPMYFERGMTHVTADYTLMADGTVQVVNQGTRKGKVHVARGRAKIVDHQTNAKLRVSFFGPFYAPYWVIGLSDNYSWAVVSDPKRRTLWILAREPKIPQTLYQSICAQIEQQGFAIDRLRQMEQ
ncbi:MAG: lipocalin family protein [Mucinivorans sp.]